LSLGLFTIGRLWVFIAVLLVSFLFVLIYLIRKEPELLAGRIRLNERESTQKRIIRASFLIFITGFLIPGPDHRYGWSDIRMEAVLAADVLVISRLCHDISRFLRKIP